MRWKNFEKELVGSQLVRSADSIGANIAEAYGRYHYGEKLRFLYYARGSLFETRYWINRGIERCLIDIQDAENYRSELTFIAKQLNSLAKQVRSKRNMGS